MGDVRQIDQLHLFSEEWIALWAICHDFDEMYPGTGYDISFYSERKT